jgi:hypothetical protein
MAILSKGTLSTYSAAQQQSTGNNTLLGDIASAVSGELEEVKKEQEQKLEEEKKAREKKLADLKKTSDEVVQIGGSLGNNVFDATFSEVEGLEERYNQALIDGDEREAARIRAELNNIKLNMNTQKEQKNTIAGIVSDDLLSDAVSDDDIDFLTAYNSGKTEYSKDADGNVTHTFNGRSLTTEDINNLAVIKPKEQENFLAKLYSNQEILALEGGQFDQEKVSNSIRQQITPKNIQPLLRDKLFGNKTSIYEELSQPGGMGTISIRDLKTLAGDENIDKDGDGILDSDISEELKAKLLDGLTNPSNENYSPEVTQEFLVNYFTQQANENYSKGAFTPATGQFGDLRTNIGADSLIDNLIG